jgi:hypothetical protein
MTSSIGRSTALRAGGACVRCRRGKTRCEYPQGRPPCKNCAKGMHECYLPSESHQHHGGSPARHASHPHRPRDNLPAAAAPAAERQPVVGAAPTRHAQTGSDKLTPELIAECERVVSKTFPACVAFHKPSFVQQLKSASLDAALVYGLLTCAARYVTSSEPCCPISFPIDLAGLVCYADRRLISHVALTRPSARRMAPHRSVLPSPSSSLYQFLDTWLSGFEPKIPESHFPTIPASPTIECRDASSCRPLYWPNSRMCH